MKTIRHELLALLIVVPVLLLLLLGSRNAHGGACNPASGPLASLSDERLVNQQQETDARLDLEMAAEPQDRSATWQFNHRAEPLEKNNGTQFDVAVSIAAHCDGDAVHVRLEMGSVRDPENANDEGFARLVAGAPFAHGSWHAGATHGTSRNLRTYYGAAILNTDFRPLAFEARWQSNEGIWKALLSAGVHLFTTETMQLAVGFVQLDESDAMQRRLMLKFTGEF